MDLDNLAGTVIVDVEPGSDRFLADIRQMSTSAGQSISTHLGRATRTVLSDIVGTAGALGTTLTGITGAAAGLGIKTAAELEVANLQFETLLGSADAAEERVASLFEFAKTTPFETQPIIEASRLLQTFGGNALATEKRLTLIGDAAAASSTEISDVAFWVGRAYAAIKGGQPFGEAAARLQELAILTPEARAEMEKLQDSGADAGEVFAVLEGELGRFGGAMEKQAGTLGGLTSTLSDIASLTSAGVFRPLFEDTKETLGAVVEFAETPAFDRIEARLTGLVERATGVDIAGGITDFLEKVDPADIDRFFDRLEDGIDKVIDLKDELGGLTGVAVGAGAALGSMVARNIPILGGLAPVISPVTGILGGLVLGSDRGREALGRLGDQFGDVAQRRGPAVLDALGRIGDELGDGIGSVIDEVGPELADAADRILPTVAGLLSDLAPALGDVVEEGGHLVAEVLPEMVDLFEAGVPLLELAAPALSLSADAMGLLADNSETAVPLLIGLFAAWKAQRVVETLSGVNKGLTGLWQGLSKAPTAGQGAGLVLGGIAAVAATAASELGEAKRQGEEFADSLVSGFDPATASFDELNAKVFELDTAAKLFEAHGNQALNPFLRERHFEAADALTETVRPLAELERKARAMSLAFGINEDAAVDLAREQQELGAQFGSNADLADAFRRELDKLSGGQVDVTEATVNHEGALARLAEALGLNAANFDASTEGGRENAQALIDSRDAAIDVADAMIRQQGDVDGARRFMLGYVDSLKETLSESGFTREEIDKLLATYSLTPSDIETAVKAVGVRETIAVLDNEYLEKLGQIPAEKQTRILALIDKGKLDEAKAAIDDLVQPRRIQFFADLQAGRITTDERDVTEFWKDTLGVPEAAGGVLDFYAGGGMRESHIAQLAPAGATRVWNEPETGGEAYIPLANDWRRGRAVDVWEETGRRLGVTAPAPRSVSYSIGTIQVLPTDDPWRRAGTELRAMQFLASGDVDDDWG